MYDHFSQLVAGTDTQLEMRLRIRPSAYSSLGLEHRSGTCTKGHILRRFFTWLVQAVDKHCTARMIFSHSDTNSSPSPQHISVQKLVQ